MQIPEGDVAEIAIGGATAWSAEKWDVTWTYNGELPDWTEWDYADDTRVFFVDGEKSAAKLVSAAYGDAKNIRPRLKTGMLYGEKAVFEIGFLFTEETHGRYALFNLGGGLDVQMQCLVTPNESEKNRLTVLFCDETGEATTRDFLISRNHWHTLRLELNAHESNTGNNFLLDGETLLSIYKYQLKTPGYEGAQISVNGASIWLRKMRYLGLVKNE